MSPETTYRPISELAKALGVPLCIVREAVAAKTLPHRVVRLPRYEVPQELIERAQRGEFTLP